MLQGIKQLAERGLLIRELRRLRQTVLKLDAAVTRIAEALEAHNTHTGVTTTAPAEAAPAPLEITYVTTESQEEFMDIEMRLTNARGTPPTEEEVLQEYVRRHPGQDPLQ